MCGRGKSCCCGVDRADDAGRQVGGDGGKSRRTLGCLWVEGHCGRDLSRQGRNYGDKSSESADAEMKWQLEARTLKFGGVNAQSIDRWAD